MYATARDGAILFFLLFPVFVLGQSSADVTIESRYGENINPPTVPGDVQAVPISSSQIDVSWSASFDPFGVAGYQVFRSGLQIATTTAINFSDTGLAASTTYSYTIRAFDVDGLVSSSSLPAATTTFSLPPPVTSTSTPVTAGSFRIPLLQNFSLERGIKTARFEFGVQIPVTYRLRYGTDLAPEVGVISTDVLRQQHTIILNDLVPNTMYYYSLYVVDQFGHETLMRSGAFATMEQFSTTMPSNVTLFSAHAVGNDVMLWWTSSNINPYSYVRIVRNERFFPSDPLDGTVVYQGSADYFVDIGAMLRTDRQYYTIFAYDSAGNSSSGLVAFAARSTPLYTLPPDRLVPPGDDPEDGVVEDISRIESVELTARDVIFIQNDLIQTMFEPATLQADTIFTIRVPVSKIPTKARVVLVTFWRSEDNYSVSFLLRLNEQKDYYQAVLPPLAQTGVYDVQIDLYNGLQERFFSLRGLFAVKKDSLPDKEIVETEQFLLIGIIYTFLGGVAGTLLALGLYWVFRWWFVVLRRRRSEDEDNR